MNPESKTIADLQAANLSLKQENTKLKADKSELENQIADLESIITRLKAKNRPSGDNPPPGITRANFGG